jgi:hypothetical protein
MDLGFQDDASRQKRGTLLACTPWVQGKKENPAQPPSLTVLVGRKLSCRNGAGARALQNRRKRGNASKEPPVQRACGRRG